MANNICVFTDGSSGKKDCDNNRCGGIGVYFPNNNDMNYYEGFKGKRVTNQRTELYACIKAIRLVKKKFTNWELSIYTDSMYTINCITKWSTNWIKNGWKRTAGKNPKEILNLDLIKLLYKLVQKYNVKFTHVRGHQKKPKDEKSEKYKLWFGNDQADRLAKKGKLEKKN